jgi:hypothetical protein
MAWDSQAIFHVKTAICDLVSNIYNCSEISLDINIVKSVHFAFPVDYNVYINKQSEKNSNFAYF